MECPNARTSRSMLIYINHIGGRKMTKRLEIIYRPLEELKPYENNPRINDDAVEFLVESIKEFGWKTPMVIDTNGVIVCGHTRYKAAKLLGETEIPCIIADDLSQEQIMAYRIADNKLAEIASWDKEKLRQEFEALDMTEFDMTMFGFSELEIQELKNLDDIEDALEIEKTKDDGETSNVKNMTFLGNKVPMTEEEAAKLEELYNEYTDLQNTNFGFVGYLLERREE